MSVEETEFERLLDSLQGLTRTQIVDLVCESVSQKDAETFVMQSAGLSLEILRCASARVLLRSAVRG